MSKCRVVEPYEDNSSCQVDEVPLLAPNVLFLGILLHARVFPLKRKRLIATRIGRVSERFETRKLLLDLRFIWTHQIRRPHIFTAFLNISEQD